jgi:rhodanese-related sulfurtransferase
MQTISREMLQRRLLQNILPPFVIEVTMGETYQREHLPGAIQLSVAELDDWIERQHPNKDDEIILYSDASRSPGALRAARQLEGLGFSYIRYYPGGKDDWIFGHLPLESDDYEGKIIY